MVNASDARFVTNTERKHLIDVRLKKPRSTKKSRRSSRGPDGIIIIRCLPEENSGKRFRGGAQGRVTT